MLTISIVNFNTKDLLHDCLKSIFDQKWKKRIEVWVVDNNSSDGSVIMLKHDFPRVKIIENSQNLGFAAANNLVIQKNNNPYCLLLNSDTQVLPGSLNNLVDFMEQNNYGIGSCKVLNPDRSLQPNTGDLPLGLALFSWLSGLDDFLVGRKKLPSFHRRFADYYQKDKEVGWVSGSVMIISKKVINKIGLLDDKIFMYGEDTEYCLRAKKAGFKIGWTKTAEIIHLGGRSSSNPAFTQWLGEFKGLIYIYQKHFGRFSTFTLRGIINLFIILRIVAFLIIGKTKISKTYAKILFSL